MNNLIDTIGLEDIGFLISVNGKEMEIIGVSSGNNLIVRSIEDNQEYRLTPNRIYSMTNETNEPRINHPLFCNQLPRRIGEINYDN